MPWIKVSQNGTHSRTHIWRDDLKGRSQRGALGMIECTLDFARTLAFPPIAEVPT